MKNVKMFKLFKNKKGINDISIASIILAIFLLTAIIIPFVNSEFGQDYAEYDTDKLERDIKDDAENVGTFNAFSVLLTVIKLALWDIGNTLNLPFWLDAIYSLLGIIFILIIARNVWVGGGG